MFLLAETKKDGQSDSVKTPFPKSTDLDQSQKQKIDTVKVRRRRESE